MLLEGNLPLYQAELWLLCRERRWFWVFLKHLLLRETVTVASQKTDLVSHSHLCTISLALLKMRAIQFIFSSFSSCPSSQNCHEGILLSCLLEPLSPLAFFPSILCVFCFLYMFSFGLFPHFFQTSLLLLRCQNREDAVFCNTEELLS